MFPKALSKEGPLVVNVLLKDLNQNGHILPLPDKVFSATTIFSWGFIVQGLRVKKRLLGI